MSAAETERLQVSAFVIAKDEAARIGAALESVRDLVDEVVVVEWGSTDETVAIAEKHGARVVHNEWRGYGPQKRFAESCCTHRWLLNLDADEALSPELQQEMRQLFAAGEPACDAYRLVIRAVCPHETAPMRWAYANSPIRLYDREHGSFAESTVHDSVVMDHGSVVGQLPGEVYHRGMLSLDQLVGKINSYTTLQAEDFVARKSASISWWRMLTVLPAAFFKSFVLRRHFVWGRYGFAISMSYAFARLLRVAKIHEQQMTPPPPERQIPQEPVELRKAA